DIGRHPDRRGTVLLAWDRRIVYSLPEKQARASSKRSPGRREEGSPQVTGRAPGHRWEPGAHYAKPSSIPDPWPEAHHLTGIRSAYHTFGPGRRAISGLWGRV